MTQNSRQSTIKRRRPQLYGGRRAPVSLRSLAIRAASLHVAPTEASIDRYFVAHANVRNATKLTAIAIQAQKGMAQPPYCRSSPDRCILPFRSVAKPDDERVG